MIFKNKIASIIVLSTIIRCFVALTIGLGNDEVYYVEYAQHLQWNYFDHPPLVALLIRLSTFNLYFLQDFFIRLGPILLAAANTYLIYKIAKKIKGENAGIFAALLFTASIYSSIISGVFILPDSSQLFFWICSVYCLTNLLFDTKSVNRNLLLFGFFTGLCIMSKVHGVFLWFGFGLFILIYQRQLLKNPFLYLSVLISLVIISPILFWNIDNDFITYKFHSERVTINGGINIDSFIREFFGGFFYNNPINYVLLMITLFMLKRSSLHINYKRILILLSVPLIIILLFTSLFRDTLPHWSGPGYTTLIILTACCCSEYYLKYKKWVHAAVYFTLFISVVGVGVINYFPGTLGQKQQHELGRGDATLDMYQWDFFKLEFEKFHKSKNKTDDSEFIISNKWFPASHIDKYIAQPLHLNFVAIGKLDDIHTFYWLNKERKPILKGDNAYFFTFTNDFNNPNSIYEKSFEKIIFQKTIIQYRSGKPVRKMYIYLLKNYKDGNEFSITKSN